MLHKQRPDCRTLAKALQHAAHCIAVGFQFRLPGFFAARHVVAGMIPRHQHERRQNYLADGGILRQLLPDAVQRGIALHRGDQDALTLRLEHMLHLGVGGVGEMGRAVAHQNQRLVRLGLRQPLQQPIRHGSIVRLRVQQRHAHAHLHPQAVGLQLRQHLFVFLPMHHMGGLHRHMGEALLLQPVHGLIDIVDPQAVPLAELPDNHAAGKSPANLPVRERRRQRLLRGRNGLFQRIGIGGAEGHRQNRFLHWITLFRSGVRLQQGIADGADQKSTSGQIRSSSAMAVNGAGMQETMTVPAYRLVSLSFIAQPP